MVLKASAVAHPMQGLVKYHGLRDWILRIPYHDSVSANVEALWTKTTVTFGGFGQDEVSIEGARLEGKPLERCIAVLDLVRKMADLDLKARVTSQNSLPYGEVKGLGFSSSGGAALATAAFKASKLDKKYGWDLRLISRLARRLAGSACRSAVGGYALWHTGEDDKTSYAEKFADRNILDMAMIVVPLGADFATDDVHRDVESSAFFQARIESASKRVGKVVEAIKSADLEKLGELVELDSLELHALTMTGATRLVIYRPESLSVMSEVRKMRSEGITAYFSMQTGPSVFINTYPEKADEVSSRIEALGLKTIVSRVGGEASLLRG